ncbi:hypothetical protein CHI07_16945 [Paenibacillus sp. 7884-2]|nr:hypothetical protein CHI07_16945 [Paenibacillus sp. 7884-2]
MYNQSKVVLPGRLWELSKSEDELKKRILQYMKKYPGYTVKSVKGRLAICDIHR